jgi:hypothetical protein
MYKLIFIVLFTMLFQSCGNVAISNAPELAGASVPGPAEPLPVNPPAPTLVYKQMVMAASQCPEGGANGTCRTGMLLTDLVSGQNSFFDFGPQVFGNLPFFTKVYQQGTISRFAVSQQYTSALTANTYAGTVYLIEFDSAKNIFSKILEETSSENMWAFFTYAWGDCNGDGIDDWIHYAGTGFPYKIYCRSSVNGSNLKTIYSGADLPRNLIKDVDGDGKPDILTEGAAGKISVYGSKTLAIGAAPLVTWNLPQGGVHHFPQGLDYDGDGWQDVIDTPVDFYNRSSFVYSGKTGQVLKEIISPSGEKYFGFRAGRFIAGSATQILVTVVAPVSSGGGNGLPYLTVINTDGSVAGQLSNQDYFESFAGLAAKPSCWQGCLNPMLNIASLKDLDSDGFDDFISPSISLFSLKRKAGYFFKMTSPVYFWAETPVFF